MSKNKSKPNIMNYELTKNTKKQWGVTLHQIRCTKDFKHAKKGDLGGWIERKLNLTGNAWVAGNAVVSHGAMVYDDAIVGGDAMVYGRATVSGNAIVSGNARVYGNAKVSGNERISNGSIDIFHKTKSLLNFRELSRRLGYYEKGLDSNRIPKNRQEQINELYDFLEGWVNKYKKPPI